MTVREQLHELLAGGVTAGSRTSSLSAYIRHRDRTWRGQVTVNVAHSEPTQVAEGAGSPRSEADRVRGDSPVTFLEAEPNPGYLPAQ